eukprot:TRINITY_DN900_c0_g1_i1.p1 TRINITY_DN900_c0_g1~~TRINITY_DN900_c0_g1_i1.p1  ORF type:complete len:404 (-),score=33.90 TRINITY_DN900_c0_g1_i1:61-1272(-)
MARYSRVVVLSLSLFMVWDCSADLPPQPQLLQCADHQAVPGSLLASCHVDPRQIDLVSFMVADADDSQRWPFLHLSVVVQADSNGTVFAAIPSLRPGKSYRVMARAHARGQTTGWYVKWSDVAHHGRACSAGANTAGVGVAQFMGPLVTHRHTSVRTRWVEMFRHNGNNWWSTPDPNNNVTLPDYLDAHNAADLGGAFAGLEAVVYKIDENNSSYTRYCVEVADVDLPNVTTVTDRSDFPELGGYPVTSKFADYASCASGSCFCMAYGDRSFRQPKETLRKLCPGCNVATCMCHCPVTSMKQSLTYVGMVPTETHVSHGKVVIGGRWYSLPPGGACAVGANVGDNGCTWQASPLSHSISLGTAKDVVFGPSIKGNLDAARKLFQDLGAQDCGAAFSVTAPLLV